LSNAELDEEAHDKQLTFVALTIMQMLLNDNDSILCKEIVELFLDQPRIMYVLLRNIVEKNCVVDPATIDLDSNSDLNSESKSAQSSTKKSKKKRKGTFGLTSMESGTENSPKPFVVATPKYYSQTDMSSMSHTGMSGMLEPIVVEKTGRQFLFSFRFVWFCFHLFYSQFFFS
jgi:hypothetical protein